MSSLVILAFSPFLSKFALPLNTALPVSLRSASQLSFEKSKASMMKFDCIVVFFKSKLPFKLLNFTKSVFAFAVKFATEFFISPFNLKSYFEFAGNFFSSILLNVAWFSTPPALASKLPFKFAKSRLLKCAFAFITPLA